MALKNKEHTPTQPFDPVFSAINLIDDSWSWVILHAAIVHRLTRFSDFQSHLRISPKILSARLKKMAAGGMFVLLPSDHKDGTFLYQLTDMGRDFAMCLMAAERWGLRWGATENVDGSEGHEEAPPLFACAACRAPIKARDVEVISLHRPSSDFLSPTRRRLPDIELIERAGVPAIAYTLSVVGDRWSALVIREAFLGTRRFSDFEQQLGIATNILSHRLEMLCKKGVFYTAPSEEGGVRHSYRLTAKGHDLYSVPLSLFAWGDKWLDGRTPRTELRHTPCGKKLRISYCAPPKPVAMAARPGA